MRVQGASRSARTEPSRVHAAMPRETSPDPKPPAEAPRKVLFVTSEMADFVKVGGLGDVSAALPRALRQRLDVRVLIPGYREVLARAARIEPVARLPAFHDVPACEVGRLVTPDGLVVYVLLSPALYEREGTPYGERHGVDWPDNDLRFARLSLAAAEFARGLADAQWRPDLLHLNDWPTALAPVYLAATACPVPSVLTIHNLAYQGLFPGERAGALGIPEQSFQIDGVEFHGRLSFLKGGLFYASHLTTVSPTYAAEITSPQFGCGLEGLLRRRAEEGRLTGILNGLDESWDPRSDPHLADRFEVNEWDGKEANAEHIRRAFGLPDSSGPLFAVVSRLVQQKGVDLTIAAAEAIVAEGGQLIVTGRGESGLEASLQELADRHPSSVAVRIGYEEGEARRIYAGSDFLLMPSRFEPCGLSQMCAQRFGSLPVAHQTGGLADTIEDGITGFLFRDFSLRGLLDATKRAFAAFSSRGRLNAMRRAAMTRPVGWRDAAQDYGLVYTKLVPARLPFSRRAAHPRLVQGWAEDTKALRRNSGLFEPPELPLRSGSG